MLYREHCPARLSTVYTKQRKREREREHTYTNGYGHMFISDMMELNSRSIDNNYQCMHTAAYCFMIDGYLCVRTHHMQSQTPHKIIPSGHIEISLYPKLSQISDCTFKKGPPIKEGIAQYPPSVTPTPIRQAMSQ